MIWSWLRVLFRVTPRYRVIPEVDSLYELELDKWLNSFGWNQRLHPRSVPYRYLAHLLSHTQPSIRTQKWMRDIYTKGLIRLVEFSAPRWNNCVERFTHLVLYLRFQSWIFISTSTKHPKISKNGTTILLQNLQSSSKQNILRRVYIEMDSKLIMSRRDVPSSLLVSTVN